MREREQKKEKYRITEAKEMVFRMADVLVSKYAILGKRKIKMCLLDLVRWKSKWCEKMENVNSLKEYIALKDFRERGQYLECVR